MQVGRYAERATNSLVTDRLPVSGELAGSGGRASPGRANAASLLGKEPAVQGTICVRDELVLEAHPDRRYILLRREGEPGAVRVYLNEARYLVDVMCKMAGLVAGDDEFWQRQRIRLMTKP